MTTDSERQASFRKMELFALQILHGRLKTRKEQKDSAYFALRHYPSYATWEEVEKYIFKEE